MLTRLTAYVLDRFLARLPFETATSLADHLLAAQGFGSGGSIGNSGELTVIKRLDSASPVLFDVGSHIGEYAQAFLECHPTGTAYCFEPSARHFGLLSERLGRRPNVHLMNIALGAAFLAAEAGQPVTPVHVLRAASTEYGKLGKALTDAETRGLQ